MRNFRGIDIVQIPFSFYLLILIGLAWGITTIIVGPYKDDEMDANLARNKQNASVVVCLKDIPKDSRIDATMVITSLPSKLSDGAQTETISRESEAIGRVATHPLKRGQKISEDDLK